MKNLEEFIGLIIVASPIFMIFEVGLGVTLSGIEIQDRWVFLITILTSLTCLACLVGGYFWGKFVEKALEDAIK